MPRPRLLLCAARRTALLLALAAALAGCFRLEVDVTVEDDGAGSFSMLAAMSDQMLAMADGDNPFLEAQAAVDPAAMPEGAVVESYAQDGFTGTRWTFPFAAGGDVGASIDRAAQRVGGSALTGANGPFERFELRRVDGEWRFQAVIRPLAGDDAPSSLGLDPQSAALAQQMLANGWYRVRITLPGELLEHDADRVEAGALVWEIDIFAAEPRTLTAASRVDAGLPAPLVIALAALAILALAALAWLFLRPRAHSSP